MLKYLFIFILSCVLSACASSNPDHFSITATPSLRVVYLNDIYTEFPVEVVARRFNIGYLVLHLQGYKKLNLLVQHNYAGWKIGAKYFAKLPAAIVVASDDGVVHAYNSNIIGRLLEKEESTIKPKPGYLIIDRMPGKLPAGVVLAHMLSAKSHVFSSRI